MNRTTHSPCSFVPPYLLRELAARPTAAGGHNAAEATLLRDEDLRRRRNTAPTSPTLPEPPATAATPAAPTAVAPAAPAGRRLIYDANNTMELPGEVARTDDQEPTGDAAVDEAHTSSGQVIDLFAGVFGRDSFDGRGGTAEVTVHYGVDYDNAFWDGERFVFGDGDGEVFDRFTKPADVMAHEYTHGVVQYSANLTYSGQSGALNESVADAFAAMTKQQVANQTADQADWLIGVGLFLPGVQAKALRSMTEPGTAYDDPRIGKDPQVGSMADYVETTEDNGGVHINSGIPNRAFALAAIALGGHSWERAGKVWYDALTAGEVGPDADFTAFAEATVASAARVFPDDTAVGQAIRTAWTEVGVLSATPNPVGGAGSGPAPATDGETIAVKRTGGFTGGVRTNVLDLAADPRGEEVRRLLNRVDVSALSAEDDPPQPDRFVYTVEYGSVRVTVGESQLGPDLTRVVQIVLDHSRRTLE